MKKSFKVLLAALLMFSLMSNVHAETGKYAYKSLTYCFKKDGSYSKTIEGADTSCSGLYSGTVVKTVNGNLAYCVEGNTPMSRGSSCSTVGYNQLSWMKGNWTEANAVKVGYLMQYINSQSYSDARKYVYIVNGAQQMLQFSGSYPVRTLNSNISKAIDYAEQQAKTYKAMTTNTPVTASFASNTLTNVDNNYAYGVVNVAMVNGSYHADMYVSATCTNCTLYTDAALTQVYNGTGLSAGASQNLQLYAKTNAYQENTDISVTFAAQYGAITYPIAKLWDCGSGKQPLVTPTTTTFQPESATSTTAAKVPPIKRVCQVYNNNYYGKNGTVVTEQQYKDECLKICKVDGGKYYGKDGKEVDKTTYIKDCTKPVCKVVDGKYYGKDGKEVDKSTYTKECTKPVCKVVDGKYYGKTGIEVNEATYKSECSKICVVSDGNYYGSNGIIVNEETYKYECTKPVCGVRDGKYYGLNATEVSLDEYRRQCEPSTTVVVPSTGSNASALPYAIGSLLIVGGVGSIAVTKKKKNYSK